jgi:Lrp/AsnC family leucine-responsive transcriptional regulator
MAKRPPALDRIDVKILAALQRNGRMTIQNLADVAGLTPRPCLERVRRLETAGIIAGYQAVLALERISNPVTIFAEIVLERQGRQDHLEKRLVAIEEVVECWEVSGDRDYLARFVCSDLARYETLTTDIIDNPDLGVARIVSHIALRPVRRFAGYPASLLAPRASNRT